jgi:hypothetical protein
MHRINQKAPIWRYASIATHYPPLSNLEIPIGITGNPFSDRRSGRLWQFNEVGKWLKLVTLRYTLGWPSECPLLANSGPLAQVAVTTVNGRKADVRAVYG